MCDKQCLCKTCKNGSCGNCKHFNKAKINECRLEGIDICKYYKKRFKYILKDFFVK